jgi:hypothetical protein
MIYGSVGLDFACTLMKTRLGVDVVGSFNVSLLFTHGSSPSDS